MQKNLVQTGFFHVLAARRIDHPQDLARFDRPMLDPITNLRSSGGLRLRQHDPQQRSDLCDADPHGRGGRGELLLAVFGNPHRLFSQRCILAGQTLVLLEDGLQVGMGFEQFDGGRPSLVEAPQHLIPRRRMVPRFWVVTLPMDSIASLDDR